jgi:putrescine transport system ATP-binding protein
MSADIRDKAAPVAWEDPGAKPLIEFKSVTKRFGSFTAIDDLSLKIYEREFFALLGPSGCGKTTLMRMLAGFETPTEGEVLLDGVSIGPVPANKRPVNMMFQSYALFPHLSVFDNIAFGLHRDRVAKAEVKQRVEDMLELVQLSKFALRKPHQISGGQRQRVALARALAKRPKLLLLDEPLAALDKKLRQQTQFELMDIQEKLGTTFLIVTHDQEEAMTVATRIAVMDHGKMIQVDTPDQIYEHPNNRYVADFIGEVNLIEGKAGSFSEGAGEILWAEGQPPIRIKTKRPVTQGQDCCFAIRPEKVRISAEQPRDMPNAIQGQIFDIAYLGNSSTYHVRLDNGTMVTAQESNVRRLASRRFSWDENIWLSWTETAGVYLTA